VTFLESSASLSNKLKIAFDGLELELISDLLKVKPELRSDLLKVEDLELFKLELFWNWLEVEFR
jgi:hypothetical protein